ncbi:MAG: hypothetical protein LBF74_01090 [Treponema sp.]|jgi:hypothetical protein|nr:hypothetical protein [Treponema sp.]
MGRGILKAQLPDFDQIGERADRDIQPRRRENYDLKYDYADPIKSAYGVFFFQHPSMLNFQQELKWKHNRSNAETVLDVRKIPSNNQLTRLLDKVEPEWFAETFNNNLKLAEQVRGARGIPGIGRRGSYSPGRGVVLLIGKYSL